MPSIKNFDKKSGKKTESLATANENTVKTETDKVTKRRPGRDGEKSDFKVKVVHVENETTQEGHQMETQAEQPSTNVNEAPAAATAQQAELNKIEIQFPGSELIRSKFPLPFDLAESVATDWVNDGKFEQLPLHQPLAKTFAQQGLLKAKELEKKVMASPAAEKIAMQAFTYAMKAQGLFNEIKSKVQKK